MKTNQTYWLCTGCLNDSLVTATKLLILNIVWTKQTTLNTNVTIRKMQLRIRYTWSCFPDLEFRSTLVVFLFLPLSIGITWSCSSKWDRISMHVNRFCYLYYVGFTKILWMDYLFLITFLTFYYRITLAPFAIANFHQFWLKTQYI